MHKSCIKFSFFTTILFARIFFSVLPVLVFPLFYIFWVEYVFALTFLILFCIIRIVCLFPGQFLSFIFSALLQSTFILFFFWLPLFVMQVQQFLVENLTVLPDQYCAPKEGFKILHRNIKWNKFKVYSKTTMLHLWFCYARSSDRDFKHFSFYKQWILGGKEKNRCSVAR